MQATTFEGSSPQYANDETHFEHFVNGLFSNNHKNEMIMNIDGEMVNVAPVVDERMVEWMKNVPPRTEETEEEKENNQSVYNMFGRDNPYAHLFGGTPHYNQAKRQASDPLERETREEKDYPPPYNQPTLEEMDES